MSENTLELAENKLLLLYIFRKIKVPVSNNSITQIILENNLINYFILQQYLDELLESRFIEYVDPENNHRMIITQKGIKVLNLFETMLSKDKMQVIDDYFNKRIDTIEEDISVDSSYSESTKDNFIVKLKAYRNKTILINITLNVNSKKEAEELCSKWKNNTSDLYYRIIQTLLEN